MLRRQNCLMWSRTDSCSQILNRVYLQDFNGIRRYLLEKTQHMIGGFGKMPGDLPGESCMIGVLVLKSSKRVMAEQTYYTLITVLLRWP